MKYGKATNFCKDVDDVRVEPLNFSSEKTYGTQFIYVPQAKPVIDIPFTSAKIYGSPVNDEVRCNQEKLAVFSPDWLEDWKRLNAILKVL